MDPTVQTPNETIRKIEDIIDLQKASGNFGVRQVAFSLPMEETENMAVVSQAQAGLARSLESGLSHARGLATEFKKKKQRSKRHKSPMPDVISWPSDSDITVLRMKLCLGGGAAGELKEAVGDIVPGDGLHRPDSSSMVNLATLMLHSRSPSKHSAAAALDEYLLPLTSWEAAPRAPARDPHRTSDSHQFYDTMHSKDSELYSRGTKKSRIARFLRLYFCPCCTCLYEIEKMREEPSVYLTKRQVSENN